MIEIFKTDVQKVSQAKRIVDLLNDYFPGNRINFDLQDCDKVLRIEGDAFRSTEVIMLVKQSGFTCNILD